MNRLFLAMLMMKEGDAKKAIHSERIRPLARSLAVLVRLRYEWIFLPSFLPFFLFSCLDSPDPNKTIYYAGFAEKEEGGDTLCFPLFGE